MALAEKHILEIVELYDKGNGDSIADLAQTYNLTKAAVTYHLKKHGVYVAPEKTEKAVSQDAAQSDEDLGIGEDEPPPQAGAIDIASLLSNPDVAKAIDAMIEQRMRAAAPTPIKHGSEAAFEAFLSKFDHMLEVQSEQRPGYIKPLSADVIDSRNQGRKDMFALLQEYRDTNVWPEYLLSDESNPFYGPSANGDVLYEAGQTIATRKPPGEGWQPRNEAAINVYSAYKRWIGEVVPIEDLIAQAAAIARGDSGAQVAEMPTQSRITDPDVRLIDEPKRDVAPKRVLGTTTPELRGKTMPRQPGVAPEPAGPVFVADV